MSTRHGGVARSRPVSPSAEPPLGVRAILEVARMLWVLREVAGVCPIFFCFLALSLRRRGVHPHLPRRLGVLSQQTGRGWKNGAGSPIPRKAKAKNALTCLEDSASSPRRLGEDGSMGLEVPYPKRKRRAVRWHGPHVARASGRTYCLWHILEVCDVDNRSHYRGNRCPLCRG